jgi:hypothetical protein
MMMETVVYAREYSSSRSCMRRVSSAKIQFLQASHQQDMDGVANYWPGLRHVVRDALRRADARADECQRGIRELLWLGTIRPELAEKYGSSFAVETAHMKLKGFRSDGADHPLALRHGAAVSGKHRRLRLEEDPSSGRSSNTGARAAHREAPEPKIPKKVKVPDYAKRLPKQIRDFTTKGVYDLGRRRTSASRKAPGMAARTRTSCTNFSPRWSKTATHAERQAVRELDLRRALRA